MSKDIIGDTFEANPWNSLPVINNSIWSSQNHSDQVLKTHTESYACQLSVTINNLNLDGRS